MARKFSPHTEPWERQPREPDKGWRAFLLYRDIGLTRSYGKVAEKLGVSSKNVEHMARRQKWAERTRHWDNHVDRQSQAAQLEAGRAAAKNHAALAAASMAVLTPIAIALDKRVKDGRLMANLDTMSARELLRLAQQNAPAIKALVEVERLSHGMTNNNLGISGPDGGPVKTVSTADLLLEVFSQPEIVDGGSRRDAQATEIGAPRPDAEE